MAPVSGLPSPVSGLLSPVPGPNTFPDERPEAGLVSDPYAGLC